MLTTNMLFLLFSPVKLPGVAKTISHIIKLVMAGGKCFHYPGYCSEIALFCDKNHTPIIFYKEARFFCT